MMWQTLVEEARAVLAPDRRLRVFEVRADFQDDALRLTGEVHSLELHQGLLDYLRRHQIDRIADHVTVLPHQDVRPKAHAIVSVSVANVRFQPSHAAELATQVVLGTPVSVLKQVKGTWLLVQTLDGYVGWTDAHVVRCDDEELGRWIERPKIIITARCGWSQRRVSDAEESVSDLVQGAVLARLGESVDHYHVGYPDGREAYVVKAAAMPLGAWRTARTTLTLAGIEKTARSYLGIPYLWGGTSTKAMDCSGFVQLVLFQNGALIERDADQQMRVGTPVELGPGLDGLAPGDGLFFSVEDEPSKIDHVGLYLGRGAFVHASRDVHLGSLDPTAPDFDALRRRTLVAARRFLNGTGGAGLRPLGAIPFFARAP